MCTHEKTQEWVNGQVWCHDCGEEITGELDRPAILRIKELEKGDDEEAWKDKKLENYER